tara:strand:- start:28 stop:555 length:528 start_codon:yes stop_codon:yes gene_type:complete
MTSKLKTDVLETVSGSGTIALTNQLSGMTYESMAAGSVIQVVTNSHTQSSSVSTSSTSYVALGSAFELAITPKYANSLIICEIHLGMQWNNTASSALVSTITKAGSVMNSVLYGSAYNRVNGSGYYGSVSLREFDVAGGTSAITYGMSFFSNHSTSVSGYFQNSAYNITLTEIKQ